MIRDAMHRSQNSSNKCKNAVEHAAHTHTHQHFDHIVLIISRGFVQWQTGVRHRATTNSILFGLRVRVVGSELNRHEVFFFFVHCVNTERGSHSHCGGHNIKSENWVRNHHHYIESELLIAVLCSNQPNYISRGTALTKSKSKSHFYTIKYSNNRGLVLVR